MKRILTTLAVLSTLLIGSVWFAENTPAGMPGYGAAAAQETGAGQAAADTDAPQPEKPASLDMVLGNPDAPVTIVEYASFTCPHCATFHRDVLPMIKKNYVDSGKVKLVMREVYFDRFGLWAGMLAHCSGETRYFGVADMLFRKQKEWLAGGNPQEAADNLRKIGRAAGMSDDDLDACFANEELARALIEHYRTTAGADEIDGTPSFVINGQKYPNMSYEDFVKVIEEKLSETGGN